MSSVKADTTKMPPFDTADLREMLKGFLDTPFADPIAGVDRQVGNFKWGAYAFYDYDGEPIYIGQTNEQLRTRIRRHLTNQRTDAVAMSVLDPFEVMEIEVWPLPQFQDTDAKNKVAKHHLNALEAAVFGQAVMNSRFAAVLNEKDPPPATVEIEIPPSHRASIVSPKIHELRAHPDFRIARRAMITARLAQAIAEREVKGGLRRALVTQTKRLRWLAERRYEALGGAAIVERKSDEAAEE